MSKKQQTRMQRVGQLRDTLKKHKGGMLTKAERGIIGTLLGNPDDVSLASLINGAEGACGANDTLRNKTSSVG